MKDCKRCKELEKENKMLVRAFNKTKKHHLQKSFIFKTNDKSYQEGFKAGFEKALSKKEIKNERNNNKKNGNKR